MARIFRIFVKTFFEWSRAGNIGSAGAGGSGGVRCALSALCSESRGTGVLDVEEPDGGGGCHAVHHAESLGTQRGDRADDPFFQLPLYDDEKRYFDIYNRSLVHEKYESAQLSSVRYFHDDTLDSQVETNDLALLISIAVDKMPDQRRRIFRMSRYEGLSNRETPSGSGSASRPWKTI